MNQGGNARPGKISREEYEEMVGHMTATIKRLAAENRKLRREKARYWRVTP